MYITKQTNTMLNSNKHSVNIATIKKFMNAQFNLFRENEDGFGQNHYFENSEE
jgi:hypothetical protein